MKQVKKENWIQSDFSFDELEIGTRVLFVDVDTISEVIGKTSSSIQTKNYANQNSRYKTGQKDASGEVQEGRLKGINATNWYILDDFNRTFKRV